MTAQENEDDKYAAELHSALRAFFDSQDIPYQTGTYRGLQDAQMNFLDKKNGKLVRVSVTIDNLRT